MADDGYVPPAVPSTADVLHSFLTGPEQPTSANISAIIRATAVVSAADGSDMQYFACIIDHVIAVIDCLSDRSTCIRYQQVQCTMD